MKTEHALERISYSLEALVGLMTLQTKYSVGGLSIPPTEQKEDLLKIEQIVNSYVDAIARADRGHHYRGVQ